MAFEITIQPSGHKYLAEPEETILEAGLKAGHVLPYGCRDGACGSCKGKLIAGQVSYGAARRAALSPEEEAAGTALFCCAKPRSDLVIQCREVGAAADIPVKTLPCRVQKIERLASDVVVLHLKLPLNERLLFLAGQYIDFLLKDGRRRGFSLANAPHDDGLLQVHVRLVPGGYFTPQVFGSLKERDILRFSGPYGNFFLREESDKPIILVAGGTGFAPVKSIIEHAFFENIGRPMALYWGARRPEGLYLSTLPRQWMTSQRQFRYVPVISEPEPADPPEYRRGLVHHAVLEDHGDLSAYQVYACGGPEMVAAARADFLARGLPAEEFYADAFTFSADPERP